MRGKKGGV